MILGFVIGTCSGFAIPVAQSFGAKQEKEMRKYTFNAMFLSAVLAVIITVLTSAYFYVAVSTLDILRSTIQGIGYSGAAFFSGVFEMIARTGMALFVIPRFGYAAACFTDPSAWVSAMVFLSILFFYVMKKIQKQHTDDEQSVVYAMEN